MQRNEFGPAEDRCWPTSSAGCPRSVLALGLAARGRPDAGPTACTAGGRDGRARRRRAGSHGARRPCEMYRAALALVHGDPAATIRHASACWHRVAARTTSSPSAPPRRSAGPGSLGGRRPRRGAPAATRTSVEDLLRAGHVSDVLGCTITPGRPAHRPGPALATHSRRTTRASGWPATAPTPLARGCRHAHRARRDRARARRPRDRTRSTCCAAQELGERLGLRPEPVPAGGRPSAVLAEAEGDLVDRARACWSRREQVYLGDFSPDVRPLHAPHRTHRRRAAETSTPLWRWAVAHGLDGRAGPVVPARVRARDRWPRCSSRSTASAATRRRCSAAATCSTRLLARAERRRADSEPSSRSWSCRRWPTMRATATPARRRALRRAVELGRAQTGTFACSPATARRRGRCSIGWRTDRRLAVRATRLRAAGRTPYGAAPTPGRPSDAATTARRPHRSRRAAEPARARGAAPAGDRPGRPRHRPAPRGVAEHAAHPHQEHLRQARRQQPPRSAAPCPRARPAAPASHTSG